MPTQTTRIASTIAVAAIAIGAFAGPVAAHAPDLTTEVSTSVVCEEITSADGTIRFFAEHSSTVGARGFLNYWEAGADPAFTQPTLRGMGMTAEIQPDGSISASYDMYIPGDAGIVEAAPVFVGVAEVSAALAPSGDPQLVDERLRNGNRQFVLQGARQPLSVGGTASIPTAGTFDVTDADCVGLREALTTFSTRPDVDVSTIDRTQIGCFIEMADGFVSLDAQADGDDVSIGVFVMNAEGVFFGLAVPNLTPDGIEADVELRPAVDGGGPVVGNADVAAFFEPFLRTKFKDRGDDGWVMVTINDLAVDGSITLDLPGGSRILPMDSCLADARAVISMDHSPSQP